MSRGPPGERMGNLDQAVGEHRSGGTSPPCPLHICKVPLLCQALFWALGMCTKLLDRFPQERETPAFKSSKEVLSCCLVVIGGRHLLGRMRGFSVKLRPQAVAVASMLQEVGRCNSYSSPVPISPFDSLFLPGKLVVGLFQLRFPNHSLN